MKRLGLIGLLVVLVVGASGQVPAVRVSSGVMARLLVHNVMPPFPPEAAAAHVNGAVVMHVVIGEDGTVRGASVVSGPEMLRQASLDAVRQ